MQTEELFHFVISSGRPVVRRRSSFNEFDNPHSSPATGYGVNRNTTDYSSQYLPDNYWSVAVRQIT